MAVVDGGQGAVATGFKVGEDVSLSEAQAVRREPEARNLAGTPLAQHGFGADGEHVGDVAGGEQVSHEQFPTRTDH